jgi:hypothetical protein
MTVDVAAPGRLVASQSTVDLGLVPFDVMKEARFELANAAGAVVRLADKSKGRMLQGCWPATPAATSMAIKPGETLVVRYPYIVRTGMGGPHRFEIPLATDSRETPAIVLTLVAVSGGGYHDDDDAPVSATRPHRARRNRQPGSSGSRL